MNSNILSGNPLRFPVPLQYAPTTLESSGYIGLSNFQNFSDKNYIKPMNPILMTPTTKTSMSTSPTMSKSRQAFSLYEDATLRHLVKQFGESNWGMIAMYMPNRNARQCRDRWKGYLRPNLSTKGWTENEDRILIDKYNEIGPKWTLIGRFLPDRSEVSIKSRWKILSTYCTAENIKGNRNTTNSRNDKCDSKEIMPMAVFYNAKKENTEGKKCTTEHTQLPLIEVQIEKRQELEQLFNSLQLDSFMSQTNILSTK